MTLVNPQLHGMAAPPDPLVEFVAEVRRRFDSRDPQTIWECAPALRRFIKRGGITACVNAELARLKADSYYLGDWLPNEIFLHRCAGHELSVALFDTPSRYIHVLPFLGTYVPLAGVVTHTRYRLPAEYRNDVFNPALQLTVDSSGVSSALEFMQIDSAHYAYDIKVSAPTPILRFVTNSVRPLEWLFSRTTLQAWQANDADLGYTQLRIAAHVLGQIAHQSSIEPLRGLTKHAHHAVRWAAIQNLGRLNRSEALKKVRDAVHDPHPHVRRAAQKTLDRLERRAREAD